MGQRDMGKATQRNVTVHVVLGMLGGVLLITVFAVASRQLGALTLAFVLATWGLGYWLALTTPPRRQAVNAVLALAATVAALVQPLAALGLLAFSCAARHAARKREAVAAAAGKRAPAPDAASRERRAQQGGEPIAFPEMVESALLPFLSPARWSPQREMASEQLIPGYDNSPLVCLGWDSPRLVVLGGAQLLTPQNKATALDNLRKRPNRPEWQETSMDLPEGSAEVFVRLGDVLTASDLWDREFVRAAHQLAGSERVFFAVPTRASMVMATSPDPVARLAMSRVEDDEHGEFVIGAEIIAFDGDDFVVMTPMIDGEQPVRH